MANNYASGSLIVPCTKETADSVLKDLDAVLGCNEYDYVDDGLWIRQLETFDIDEAVQVVQELLKYDNDTTTMVRIEVAFTCDRPRIDNFGGAVALVTAIYDYRMTTSDWMPPLL